MKKYLLSILLGIGLIASASAVIIQTPTRIKTVAPMQGDGSTNKPVYAEVNVPNGLLQLDGLGSIPFEINTTSMVVSEQIVVGTGVLRSTITPTGFFGDGSNLANLLSSNLVGTIPTGLVDLSTVTNQFNQVAVSTTTLQANIDSEETARINADDALGVRIDGNDGDIATLSASTDTLQTAIDGKASLSLPNTYASSQTVTGGVSADHFNTYIYRSPHSPNHFMYMGSPSTISFSVVGGSNRFSIGVDYVQTDNNVGLKVHGTGTLEIGTSPDQVYVCSGGTTDGILTIVQGQCDGSAVATQLYIK